MDKQFQNLNEYLELKKKIYIQLCGILPSFIENLNYIVDVLFNIKSKSYLLLLHSKLEVGDTEVIDKFRIKLHELLLTKNQIINLDVFPIGLMTSINFYSIDAQNILNVKHLNTLTKNNDKQIQPVINITMLHRGDDIVWFRLRMVDSDDDTFNNFSKSLMSLKYDSYYKMPKNNVYEIYYKRPNKNEAEFFEQMKTILGNSQYIEEIIFYSDCKFINNSKEDFNTKFSSIFKFIYCYFCKKIDTDIISIDDKNNFLLIQIYTKILIQQSNLNTNKSKQLTPLNILTGEKSISNISSYKNEVFYTEGPRDGLLIGRGTQLGGNSKHELVIDIEK
ncbi:P47 [Tipula oleracea nudivirus]|uniref:p47 n=1 Tax=Tipula oleracea nudivirus TaxID=1546257 RepID=A0A0B4VFM8_9VIRU|nr:P47 [Tipula oleracea nudivirus]AJD20175.1 P47 [Tipula oleracea nudivirus]